MPDYGLGRRPAPDPRDHQYLMRTALPHLRASGTRYWATGPVLDQGPTPQCVGYAWRGWLAATPIRTKTLEPSAPSIYARAQLLDEWPGENYDGTSVRAGAKALEEQGHIATYHWAWTMDEVRQWVLQEGPVVFGTVWTQAMFEPDAQGFVRPAGLVVGGHAYLAVGYSHTRKAFRFQQSWGLDWGQRGRFWIRETDVGSLLQAQGEACAATQQLTDRRA